MALVTKVAGSQHDRLSKRLRIKDALRLAAHPDDAEPPCETTGAAAIAALFTLPIPASLAVAIFFTIWFTLLFAVLPIGVRSQSEGGDIVPGTDPGAPVAPRLLFKAGLTTVLSLVAFYVLVIVLRIAG